MADQAIEVTDLSKHFGEVVALEVRWSRLRSIMWPNNLSSSLPWSACFASGRPLI